MAKYMELQAGSETSLGVSPMSVDGRDNRSVPEWVAEAVKPSALTRPYLDIYTEVLQLRDDVARLESKLDLYLPLRHRVWRWLKEKYEWLSMQLRRP